MNPASNRVEVIQTMCKDGLHAMLTVPSEQQAQDIMSACFSLTLYMIAYIIKHSEPHALEDNRRELQSQLGILHSTTLSTNKLN